MSSENNKPKEKASSVSSHDVQHELGAMRRFHFGAPSQPSEVEEVYNANEGPSAEAYAPQPYDTFDEVITSSNNANEPTAEVIQMENEEELENQVIGGDTLYQEADETEFAAEGEKAVIENVGETLPPPSRSSISFEKRKSIVDMISGTAPSTRKASLDLPVHYEVARHSIDIVQRYKDPKEIVKPDTKVYENAKKKAVDIQEHEMPISQLCSMYESKYDEATDTPYGLTTAIAKHKLQVNGPNSLTPPKKVPGIIRFLKELTSLFSLMLIIAGVLTFITLLFDRSTYVDTIILGSVLFLIAIINSLITYIEERKNEKILEGFAQLAAKKTRSYRDGLIQEMDVKELVVGDIIKITAGDKLPADVRVLKSTGIRVDNSSLTGESEPQPRTKENTHKNPLETHNLMFYGTMCVEGEGFAMVIRTGNNTVIGQIASLASNTQKIETPLRREINRFVKTIGLIALIMAVVFFILGYVLKNPTGLNIIFAIGIICANIPQGLIATLSLALTVSAKRLAQKNVLVKNLESVETLGSTTLICSDKTGTLTQNRMTVVDTWCDDVLKGVSSDFGSASKKGKQAMTAVNLADESSLTTLHKLQRACVLCNRTIFDPKPENLKLPLIMQKTIGDASETALLKYYATRSGYPTVDEIRSTFPKIFEIPFNSTIKYQLSIHRNTKAPEDTPRILLIKGAPERVIKKCSSIFVEGKEEKLDENRLARFEEAYEILAARGERVLGFAMTYLSAQNGFPPSFDSEYGPQNVPQDGFTFLGLTGLQDPPKIGVYEAIQKCKTAGIQVVMVTGDHQLTAKAIAKQIKIIEDQTAEDIASEKCISVAELDPFDAPAVVLNGEQLETLSENDWARIIKKKQIVFARTSPQQKLLIVEKFQSIGHIVGVTGDGVNDSPALKKADIGISMGITGSDVSKEAASLILLDDNFASIVNGVEEGRVIFDNLKKSVTYTLTHILPEIIPFILFVIFKIPLPLSPLLLLMIDIGTDLFSAVSLAYERAESDILLRAPRSKDDNLITWPIMCYAYFEIGVIETLGCLFAYFSAFGYYGIPAWALLGLGAATSPYFAPRSPNLTIGGRIYTGAQQLNILHAAQTSYFAAIVIQQVANLLSCKTRINSLAMQGIFNNKVVFVGIIWSIILSCILFYVPGLNNVVFHAYPIPFVLWLPSIPYFILIILLSEMIKLSIRHVPEAKFLLW